ncbi:MAG: D-alanyl-D-alanine carboxypeptidase/D-alanyl-D-alanine-endopeptidase [Myxococcota bacterium]|nr:D-alanyl-D-alanine carboxypeptidase/D-alanyl-D-alanine-endopeptidase [Myxococcota bacterium]
MDRAIRSIWRLALIGVLLIGTARAQENQRQAIDFDKLGRAISAAVGNGPGNATVGLVVTDVASGREIFEKNGDKQLNPASNVKIITAACALKTLGPEFRFATRLFGRQDSAVIRGPIYIKGHADPTLATEDLWKMVRTLTAQGVRRVEGGVVVDDTYFDDNNEPYAYDQQPNEDAAFRSPVGAVSLNHNALRITISPGRQPATPARVFVDPAEYAILDNDTVTLAKGAHNPKISAIKMENRTRLRAWGQVPLGAHPRTYYRRIDNPSLFAGYGLKSVLEASGISVGGGVQVGMVPPGTPVLAEHTSPPLSVILLETGKKSNNFVTEMVLKTMGAEASRDPGTWALALGTAADVLEKWGLAKEHYTYRNGSGLFDANRFSPRQIVAVLRAAFLDSSIRPEFVNQLATGGVDGTLKSRYQGEMVRRYVRAKTGTLADVATLSGYVIDRTGTRAIAFSILINDAPGYVSAARAYQEKIVTTIARLLNP